MKKEKNNRNVKRFAPPEYKKIWLRITLPLLVAGWIFCYVGTGFFAGYVHNNEEDSFNAYANLYQQMFHRLNSRYSVSRGEDGASSMSYANYQKEAQFYLRYSGVATALFEDVDGTEGALLDSSEEKMFLSVEWPDGTTEALFSCDAEMDGAYYDFLEEWRNSSGRLNVRIREVYVNRETWEFIPGKMYLSASLQGADSDSIFYENPQPMQEGFESIVVEDVAGFWTFLPGTQRNIRTDDKKMQEWYDARVASLDHLQSIEAGGSPPWAVVSYVSPKPWMVYSLWYYVSNLFRDSRLENSIPVAFYDSDGNLKTYSMRQEHRYSLFRMYGSQILWNWLGATLLCLSIGSLLSYVSYGRKKSRYEWEAYRRNLTNTMAHDLKSPLMAISGYAENLREKVHPEKETYYMEAILDCVTYMNGIVSDMLDLGRLEQAEVSLRRERFAAETLFAELAAYHQAQMDAKNIRFSMSGTCLLDGDQKMLKRAFDNLFNNAVNYTPDGNEIKVVLDAEQIVLTNTGVSLPEEMLTKVFEPFAKADQARSGQKGSGLGLAIAKQIFDVHGMECRMESGESCVSVIVRV